MKKIDKSTILTLIDLCNEIGYKGIKNIKLNISFYVEVNYNSLLNDYRVGMFVDNKKIKLDKKYKKYIFRRIKELKKNNEIELEKQTRDSINKKMYELEKENIKKGSLSLSENQKGGELSIN